MSGFGFHPGVMIDPVTMNPVVRGGSITVNPMGMPVPVEQKPWLKFALMNIHEDMPDDLIKKLLNSLGKVVSFNRMQNQKTKIKFNYCIFQYSCGDDVVRITKFFKDVRILDRTLDLKISQETKTFLKQWMNIQKQDWRKKLNSTVSNESKQYQSLEAYLQRDDKAVQERFSNTLKDVNYQFRKHLQSINRDDERKQHPREKERDRKKRQLKQQQEKKYSQKLDSWLQRQKQKDRQYRKQKDREKDKQRVKQRKLQRQMTMDEDEEHKKISKYLSNERRKIRQKELQQDLQKIQLEWLPPEPQLLGQILAPQGPAPEEVNIQMEQRKKHVFMVQQEQLIEQVNPEFKHLMQIQVEKTQHKQYVPKADKMYTNEPVIIEKSKPINLHLPETQSRKMQQQQNNQLNPKKRQQQLFKIFKMIPRNKQGLWSFEIDWIAFNQGMILDRKIRPWLFKKCIQLFGQTQQSFISMVQKYIIKKITPDQLTKILAKALQNQAQKFVMDLWTQLIFNLLKLKNGVQL